MLARKYPELLESKMILMYKDVLPDRLATMRRKRLLGDLIANGGGGGGARHAQQRLPIGRVFVLALIAVALQYGSLSIQVQKLMLDIIPAMALVGMSWFLFLLESSVSIVIVSSLLFITMMLPYILSKYLSRSNVKNRISALQETNGEGCPAKAKLDATGTVVPVTPDQLENGSGSVPRTYFPPMRKCMSEARVAFYDSESDESLYSDEEVRDMRYDSLLDLDDLISGNGDNGTAATTTTAAAAEAAHATAATEKDTVAGFDDDDDPLAYLFKYDDDDDVRAAAPVITTAAEIDAAIAQRTEATTLENVAEAVMDAQHTAQHRRLQTRLERKSLLLSGTGDALNAQSFMALVSAKERADAAEVDDEEDEEEGHGNKKSGRKGTKAKGGCKKTTKVKKRGTTKRGSTNIVSKRKSSSAW